MFLTNWVLAQSGLIYLQEKKNSIISDLSIDKSC